MPLVSAGVEDVGARGGYDGRQTEEDCPCPRDALALRAMGDDGYGDRDGGKEHGEARSFANRDGQVTTMRHGRATGPLANGRQRPRTAVRNLGIDLRPVPSTSNPVF